jgi:hypothetical protein
MIKSVMAAAVAAMLLLPGQASAQSTSAVAVTDLSAQTTVVRKKTVVRRPVKKKVVVRRPAKRTVVVRPATKKTVVKRSVVRPAAKKCRTVKTTRRVGGRTVTSTTRRCS